MPAGIVLQMGVGHLQPGRPQKRAKGHFCFLEISSFDRINIKLSLEVVLSGFVLIVLYSCSVIPPSLWIMLSYHFKAIFRLTLKSWIYISHILTSAAHLIEVID